MIQGVYLSKLTETAIRAALSAGKEILDVYYHDDFDIEFKADNSPLTIADKRAHDMITKHLAATNIPILSEEGESVDYEVRKTWKIFWLVDPLDGTKEFIRRNDEFTVNIALVEENSPIAGVVFEPVTGNLFWGDSNGSFKVVYDAGKEVFSEAVKLPVLLSRENFVIAGSRSHMNSETEDFIRSVDTRGKRVEMRSKGSSLKICLVAEGEADIYPRLSPTMEWDTAAGHAVAKFAGKNLYLFGTKEPLSYNRENLVNPWFIVE